MGFPQLCCFYANKKNCAISLGFLHLFCSAQQRNCRITKKFIAMTNTFVFVNPIVIPQKTVELQLGSHNLRVNYILSMCAKALLEIHSYIFSFIHYR